VMLEAARRQAAVMLTNLFLCGAALAQSPALSPAAALAQGPAPAVKWSAADFCLGGGPFPIHVEIQAPKEGGPLASWMLEPAAVTVNGKPLGERREGAKIQLAPNQRIEIELDVGPMLAVSGDFKLGYGKESADSPDKEVRYMQAAPKGLDFMKMEPAELAKYHVFMQTNCGNMEIEFWPDVAPNHVRNFLDLSYTGFYDGKTFHRVIPTFMIQGGDPKGDGTGNGPRMVKAEFSSRKHVRGVLSMARSSDPNSASCQFFIMHGDYPSLDGKYSCFGKLVSGLDVVDKIVSARKNATDRPLEPQLIQKCTVVAAPGK